VFATVSCPIITALITGAAAPSRGDVGPSLVYLPSMAYGSPVILMYLAMLLMS
jgi:hypothetical protein